MAYWLLKTEPSTYSFADLEKEKETRWDGVSNPVALKNIRLMKKGDLAFIYHTGSEKSIIGIARIMGDSYQAGDRENLAVVDLKPESRLARPVTLAEVKARKDFSDFALVRISRLSVMPVSTAQWKTILEMSTE